MSDDGAGSSDKKDEAAVHPIRVAAARAGLTPATVRATSSSMTVKARETMLRHYGPGLRNSDRRRQAAVWEMNYSSSSFCSR